MDGTVYVVMEAICIIVYIVQSAIPLCYIASYDIYSKKSPRPSLLHAAGRQAGGRRACRKACIAGRQSGRKVGSPQADRKGCIGVRQEGKQTSSKKSRMTEKKESRMTGRKECR